MTRLGEAESLALRICRVLFGVLAAMNTGLLASLVWLAMRHDVAVTALGPVLVFGAWVAFLLGPWRPPEVTAARSRYVGEVSWEGVRGFGLAPEVVWRWEEVDRVLLTHTWFLTTGARQKRRIPTWALVQRGGEQIWVPRMAFSEGGWLLPQDFLRDRCGAERVSRDDRLRPPDPFDRSLYPLWMVMVCLPLLALIAEAAHWPRVLVAFLIFPFLAGLMEERVWCRWTALAFLAQSVAGMWVVGEVSVEAAGVIRWGWGWWGLALVAGLGLMRWETRRRVE